MFWLQCLRAAHALCSDQFSDEYNHANRLKFWKRKYLLTHFAVVYELENYVPSRAKQNSWSGIVDWQGQVKLLTSSGEPVIFNLQHITQQVEYRLS